MAINSPPPSTPAAIRHPHPIHAPAVNSTQTRAALRMIRVTSRSRDTLFHEPLRGSVDVDHARRDAEGETQEEHPGSETEPGHQEVADPGADENGEDE